MQGLPHNLRSAVEIFRDVLLDYADDLCNLNSLSTSDATFLRSMILVVLMFHQFSSCLSMFVCVCIILFVLV